MRRQTIVGIGIALFVLAVSSNARAQGQGHGHAYGHAHQGGVTAGSGSSTPLPASGTGIRDFGVWLDDASVAAPGGGWVSLSFNYFRSDLFREFDVPVADAGVGVTRTVQFGFTVPYYNLRDAGGGTSVHGLGDLYLHSKVQLRDPAAASNGIGFALLPIVEVLSTEAPAGRHRVNWALPFSVELQRRGWRTYASSGYFSRGSIFASGAVERPISEHVWITGTISRSFSLHDSAPDLPRVRTDIGGGASYLLRSGIILFGSVGRTMTSTDPERARLLLSGGVSINVAAPRAPRRS